MNRLLKVLALASAVLACGSQGMAQTRAGIKGGPGVVLSEVPREVDKKARYMFYLSGYIVEAGNTRPTSPKFGVYEYDQILESLRQDGFVVISEARKQTSEIEAYARKVAGRVRLLLDAGVPARNITLVGASQGSWIAMLASTYLKERGLNFVLLGSCSADEHFLQLVDLHGNVLFISEQTDRPSQCRKYRDDATGMGESVEVVTNTGQGHGFLYRPLKEWVEPAKEWARRPHKARPETSR